MGWNHRPGSWCRALPSRCESLTECAEEIVFPGLGSALPYLYEQPGPCAREMFVLMAVVRRLPDRLCWPRKHVPHMNDVTRWLWNEHNVMRKAHDQPRGSQSRAYMTKAGALSLWSTQEGRFLV
jgi:hypothetical protein